MILIQGEINGSIEQEIVVIEGDIQNESLVLEGELSFGGCDHETYEGPYTAIPRVTMQSLETKYKLMKEDVTVTEIPYAETANEYGTTVSIAS